jgi:hypothetical protein
MRTAIEVDPTPFHMLGIRLGHDFLSSGKSCELNVIHVFSGEKERYYSVKILHAGNAVPVIEELEEKLLYCSHDESIVHVPLLHFEPFENKLLCSISLKTVRVASEVVNPRYFEVCHWCNRAFPKGMLVCECCQHTDHITTYCGRDCQKHARTVHRLNMRKFNAAQTR